ncbi:AzlD domain-containing protein [Actinoalloteichus hymeniacidonis]|uniref:Branched-chain amino acid transport protein (AzlD) n=1 Tax=Actinoalloteichus hymeniacidonis TaxID=340345 RepID=A0AAC9HNX8_9PSEU|nr:AzlD domain-containing protein [Actinoalloteichus hymeniacidonis]AOS62892.1 Branched-chain amino acid transport protein (AzlD) [Actinoalloteichus hymeniacidonis]MBB5909075.1 branched-subunit amino acid transport protein [Actinoalloteichus hymeniacidonis]
MSMTTVLVLAAGTYLLRVAGPLLRGRVEVSDEAKRLLATAATTLLAALLLTSALTEAGGFAGWARPAGVAVGAVLAWRRVPFVLVVLAAAATAALLRLIGVP